MSSYTGDIYPTSSDYSALHPDGVPIVDQEVVSTSAPQQNPQSLSNAAVIAPQVEPESNSQSLSNAAEIAPQVEPESADPSTHDQETGSIVFSPVADPLARPSSHNAHPEAAVSDDNDKMTDDESSSEDSDYVDTESSGMPLKRKYNYNKRIPAPPKSHSRQKKWKSHLEGMCEQKLRRIQCCKALKCFRHVDYDYYMEKARVLLSVSYSTRRNILCSYLGSGGNYMFDGKRVCVSFLKKAFRFSSVLIAEVSRENGRASASAEGYSAPDKHLGDRNVHRHSTQTIQSNCSTRSSDLNDGDAVALKKKEAIVSFLHRLAEDCGDSMPDRSEVHLPFHQRRELYPLFVSEFQKLYPTLDPATPQYFRRTWKLHCHQFKVMKAQRFSTCDECDRLRTGLREALLAGKRTDLLKQQRLTHLEFIFAERLEYQKKKDRARLQTSNCCSIIIDGADQSAFGLPHFTTKPKAQRGHAMKVKLVGLLEHKIENRITFFTMTEEHSTGSNHIIEVLHRFLNAKREEGKLPAKFYVQLDNCSRENKNKYVMAYFELLVAVGVFETVEVGFLPVGHTHEDVDQCFSQTSARLRVHNAITLRELHHQLRQTNKGGVEVQHMKRIANFSGLCDAENCVKRLDRITQWRYFLFSRDPCCKHDLKKAPLNTKCFVKKKSTDPWQNMFRTEVGSNPNGVLRRCPDIRKTPALSITCPDGVENVTKRIDSEEGRINDTEKLIYLHELRDFVFSSRVDEFHWDVQRSVETEFCGLFSPRRAATDASLSLDNGVGNLYQENEASHQQSVGEGDFDEGASSLASQPGAHSDDIEGQTEEISHNPVSSAGKSSESNIQSEPRSKVDYSIGSFVVVQHKVEGSSDNNSDNSIWVAQVLGVEKRSNTNFAEKLNVHWYDAVDGNDEVNDIVQAKFQPCFQPVQTKKARKSAKTSFSVRQKQDKRWCDVIHTDTVLVSFPGLTKRGNLPLSVQNKISR